MTVRQQKIASFFLENHEDEETLMYLEKNAPLLKGFLLLFAQPISEQVKARCEAWELCYKVVEGCQLNKKTFSAPLKNTQSEEESIKIMDHTLLRNIRSGEQVKVQGNLLIKGNINDGALITTTGTLAIFGIIEGDINCQGEHLILSAYKRGKVVFQSEHIADRIVDDKLKMFYKEDGLIKMKELN